MIATLLSGCGNSATNDGGTDAPKSNDATSANGAETNTPSAGTSTDGTRTYQPIAADTAGEINVMMWAGDGSYMKDLGHQELTPADLTGQNQAAAYAVAKAFNQIYPNIKINVYAKVDGANDGGTSWDQERENFRNEYGKYPDLIASDNMVNDILKGMVADISVFKDDPVYQTFNPAVMETMSFKGGQFGLPQYLIPWGVFVNKTLANEKNIDVPPVDWTIDDYTDFISHSEKNKYYGLGYIPMDFLRTGTKDFVYSLTNRGENDPYVSFNSDAMKALLKYIPIWGQNALSVQVDLGNAAKAFGDDYAWEFKAFYSGKVLTNPGDPWMMSDILNPDPASWAYTADEWDIYPRPSTDYVGNTVGIVLDPFTIHNYAMDDGNSDLNDEEYAKLQLTYEFAKFWCGDIRSIEARSAQMFDDKGALRSSLNDSLPLVTGDGFDAQMEAWYTSPSHQGLADPDKTPGWHKIIELWKAGEFFDVTSKCYPWQYDREGDTVDINYEWGQYNNPDVVGAKISDANWLDQIYSHLDDWNTLFNERWEAKWKDLDEALVKYYGM